MKNLPFVAQVAIYCLAGWFVMFAPIALLWVLGGGDLVKLGYLSLCGLAIALLVFIMVMLVRLLGLDEA